MAYWRKQLLNASAVLDMPIDHPRPAVQTYRGDSYAFTLPSTLSHELQSLSQQGAVTLFMTLLAAFQVLLLRYSGQTDIVVGTPIAGRTRYETEGLIGYFVNTLALRTDLSGNPSFRALLARVREVCLEAYAHQDVPFEKVVEAVQPERSLSHHPLFQVMFTLQNASTGELALPGLRLESLAFSNPTTKFDLSIEFVETPNGLHGIVEYNIDIFERDTIQQLIKHYQRLLEDIAAHPEHRLSSLTLLGEDELHRLLVEWNATDTNDEAPVCLQQLFEIQVERTPDATAVINEDQQLTYTQLNQRANQLAHLLQARGVKPEVCVGLCMQRSPEMIVGLLGILKAGGAYVPLDPTSPVGRLAFMIQDAQLPIILTQERLVALLPVHDRQVICLDLLEEALTNELVTNLASEANPDNLAYVIYTSGSTGLPKGVMIAHRGLTNYLRWCVQEYQVALGQGSLLHSSLASDLTVTSLFAPLLVGQRLVLLSEEQAIDALGSALHKAQALSLVKLTPSHLTLLAEQLTDADVAGCVRAFIIGGEALRQEHLTFWRTHAPRMRLINEYGPTETVVGCCVYEAPEGDETRAGLVPIGRPIANTQLYLLDRWLEPVPVGVTGELYIAGAGVARGYLQRPELTTERFLPNPFSREPGTRFYRTGDLARYLPDGNLEFLGRNDQQVKLRGYRIEPGEVEALLKMYQGVQEAIVLLEEVSSSGEHSWEQEYSLTEKRLVAYLIGEYNPAPTAGKLRVYLRQHLPEYMIPAVYVMLGALPLLPNGKVDRRALPKLGQTMQEPEEVGGEPRNPVEEAIAEIWARVLGRKQVGIHDNFFDLGGHSLLVTQVISRVRENLQVELPLRVLFEKPTVADFAEEVIQKEFERTDSDDLMQMLAEFEMLPTDEV